MKKFILIAGIFALVVMFSSCDKNLIDEPFNDLELKSGNSGNEKLTGFDKWGFNWHAQQFNGYLVNMMLGDHFFMGWPHYQDTVYRGEGTDFWDMLVENYFYSYEDGSEWHYFPDIMPDELLDAKVNAHWNDGLISKEGKYAYPWFDSNAWITFRYTLKQGKDSWSHFRKLVAVKRSYEKKGKKWYDNDKEVGLVSKFFDELGLMIIQVENTGEVDTKVFYEEYKSPAGSGIGKY